MTRKFSGFSGKTALVVIVIFNIENITIKNGKISF